MPNFTYVFFFSLMGPFPGELASCGSLQRKKNLISSLKLTNKYLFPYHYIMNTVWPVLKSSPHCNNCWQGREKGHLTGTVIDGWITGDLVTRIMHIRNMPAPTRSSSCSWYRTKSNMWSKANWTCLVLKL